MGVTINGIEGGEIDVAYWRSLIKLELDREHPRYAYIAQCLLKYLHIWTLRDTKDMICYADNEGIYGYHAATFIAEEIKNNIGGKLSRASLREILFHIETSKYLDRELLNVYGEVLVLHNGRYHVAYKKFKSHSPDTIATWKLPVEYREGADCPNFKKFIGEVVEQKYIDVIQEWFGYCLCHGYPHQLAMLMVGGGSNGKSTLLGVLRALLGSKNISHVSLQALASNRFAPAQLYGKLANIYPDLSEQTVEDSAVFKMLTGGDEISGERKFKDEFNFVNSAKLVFSCNQVPKIKDESAAVYRRWLIIFFPNVFSGDKEDKGLLGKLTTPEELSGIFNWALAGLERLKSQGKFSYDLSPDAVEQLYQRLSCPEAAFLHDRTEYEETATVEKQPFYNAFKEYCKARKLPVCSETAFAKRLRQIASYIYEVKIGPDGNRKTVWKGVRLYSRTTVRSVQQSYLF